MTLRGVPDQVGRYQILSELGRGSMGHVYLALDPNIGRQVALKILLPFLKVGSREQSELRQRFLIEARAAGRLKHPGVVTLFDADTDLDTGLSFIAMEWVDGPSLDDLLRESGTLPIQRTLEILRQVALALDAAHKADLVHRDIKPANVLLTAAGQAKVTDFGIAKLTSMSVTATGWMPGSPFYMSPEQVRGHEIDGRSDLYSLGIVLYQCLTGEVPFHGESLAGMTYMIQEVDPRPPQTLNPSIGDELAALMLRALQKSPDDRFQSAVELADALRRVPAQRVEDPVPRSAEPFGDGPWTLEAPPPENPIAASISPSIEPLGTALLPMADPVAGSGQRLVEAPTDDISEWAESHAASTVGPRSVFRRAGRYGLLVLALALLFLVGPVLRTSLSQPMQATPVRVEPTEPYRLATSGTGSLTDGPGPLVLIALEPPEPGLQPEEEPAPEAAQVFLRRLRREPRPAVTRASVAAEEPEETIVAETSAIPAAVPETVPAATPAEPEPIRVANLEVVIKNRLRKAEVSVWIDEEKVWSRPVEAPKSLFKRVVGRNFFTLLPVSEGPHVIDVRVIGSEGKVDVVRRTEWDFLSGKTQRLKVTMLPPKKLKLSWGKSDG